MQLFTRIFLVAILVLQPAYGGAPSRIWPILSLFDRWWVGGGSANTWAATAPTNWATSSGGANNAAVPTSADCAFFDGSSGTGTSVIAATITVNCLTATGYTGTLTINASQVLDIETSLTLVPGMTLTFGGATTSFIQFVGSTAGQTIITGGLTLPMVTINGLGSWSLGSSLNQGAASSFTVSGGTFNSANFNITTGFLASNTTTTRSITLGTSTVTLNGVAGSVWLMTTTTGLTLSAASSTIIINDAGGGAKTFASGSKTFGALTVTPGGAGAVTFAGSPTFGAFTLTGPKSIVFTSATTQTATAFSLTGTSGNLVTITASTPTSAATLSQASGTVCGNFLSLKDSTATGGASFFAQNSTNVSGNSGWTFGACPGAATQIHHKVIGGQ